MSTQTATAPETRAPAAPILGDLGYSTIPAGLTRDELHRYRVGWDRGARAFSRKHGGPAIVHKGAAPAPGSAAHKMLANELAVRGRAYRIERQPAAHKSGMSELRRYVKRVSPDRLESIIDPMAPAPKPRAKRATRATSAPAAPAPIVAPAAPVTGSLDRLNDMREAGRLTIVHVTDTPAAPIVAPPPVTIVPETRDQLRAIVDGADIPAPTHGRRATRRALAAAMRAADVVPSGDAWAYACTLVGLSDGGAA